MKYLQNLKTPKSLIKQDKTTRQNIHPNKLWKYASYTSEYYNIPDYLDLTQYDKQYQPTNNKKQ